jgi:hypothetical protein
MGTSAKTLSRFVSLHQRGLLKNGASIVELGAQELYCSGMEEHVRGVIQYFSDRNPSIKAADLYTKAELTQFADKGLLGKLMIACGFTYRALDIFEAENTTLFDLNIHAPGKDLAEQFDLVTNFGTTEHVINQYQSLKTMHELTRPGGLIHHELPLAGYHNHGYFSYNPMLFIQLAEANGYQIVLQNYSKAGTPTSAPGFMTDNGYPESKYFDYGIEFIFQKVSGSPFRMPLETSTSLRLSKTMWGDSNPYWDKDFAPAGERSPFASAALQGVSGWALQRELVRRYRRKLASLLKLH